MAISLPNVVSHLQRLAPLAWAEDWDNVGLLLEPQPNARVRRILLTIDLTAAVCAEARAKRTDLIVAYHPPIFGGLNRLSARVPLQRTLMECVASKIAIYAPHTALDAVGGGVNDWLADGVGEGTRSPIARGLHHASAPDEVGMGRLVELERPVQVATIAQRMKKHLRLASVRTAVPPGRRAAVRKVAVCAGAGGSVVAQSDADVYVTGRDAPPRHAGCHRARRVGDPVRAHQHRARLPAAVGAHPAPHAEGGRRRDRGVACRRRAGGLVRSLSDRRRSPSRRC